MSRVPYLDRLGDSLEEAVRRHQSRPQVRQRSGWIAATAAFAVVLLVGGAWWLLSPTADEPVTGSTVATTIPEVALPVTWARSTGTPEAAGDLGFSGVAAFDGGFVAVGTEVVRSEPTGVVFVSSDGFDWSEVARVEGASLHDVAAGDGGLVAVGTRAEIPLALLSVDGDEWTPLLISAGTLGRIVQANAVAARGTGFVAAGIETDTSDERAMTQRPVVWTSDDGQVWRQISALAEHASVGVGDVASDGTRIVVAGLVGDVDGRTTAAMWVSEDSEAWNRIDLPALRPEGFVGVNRIARGPQGWVAAGFDAAGAAAWISVDGRSWEAVESPSFREEESGTSQMRANGIVATSSGYSMVGMRSDLPYIRNVFWTSPDGRSWTRYDLTDPAAVESSAIGFALAASTDRVVAVGSAFNLAGSGSVPAVWISPAPPQLVASVPLEEPTDDPAADEVRVTVLPSQAVAASQVWIRGRVPAGQEGFRDIEVWFVGDGGPIRACDASLQGRNFSCRVRLSDLDPVPAPGTYLVAIGSPDALGDVELEVLPEGTEVVTLSGAYSAVSWPLVLNVVLANKGGMAIDLTGWTIADSRVTSSEYAFEDGTVLEPGVTLIIDFGPPSNASCPESTDRYVYWCRVLGHGDRVEPWDEADHLWQGGDLEVRDSRGEVRATWSPGS